jgi:hypothetical protein
MKKSTRLAQTQGLSCSVLQRQMQPKTRVHILSFVGSNFEPCWKEKGTVLKPTARETPPNAEWHIVRFDNGDTLCIHQSRLMVANEQGA